LRFLVFVVSSKEGFAEVGGFKLFYRQFGEPEKGDVLCLHGGPGVPHDYMLPIADLADQGYRVTFYDQLGCGRSDVPRNKALFVMERYAEEVEGFRKVMGLGRPHIIGSSCGGQLGLAYALRYQKSMRSLTTVGGIHNFPLTIQEMARLRNELPDDVKKTLDEYEAAGDYFNPEYLKAVDAFYKRHLCRLEPWPAELVYAIEHTGQLVYNTMNGPNEFTVIGNIRYWDVTDKLGTIKIPTLVLSGTYDEVSPKVARDIHNHMPQSELTIFEDCSHTPFWEARDTFMKRVARFLTKH
jgi:proline iminopeptidase